MKCQKKISLLTAAAMMSMIGFLPQIRTAAEQPEVTGVNM